MENAMARKPFEEGRMGRLAVRALILLVMASACVLADGDPSAAQAQGDQLAIAAWRGPSPAVFNRNGEDIGSVSVSELPALPVPVLALMNSPREDERPASGAGARVGFLHDGALVYVSIADVGLTPVSPVPDESPDQDASRSLAQHGMLSGLMRGAAPAPPGAPTGGEVTARLARQFELPVCPGDPRCADIAPRE